MRSGSRGAARLEHRAKPSREGPAQGCQQHHRDEDDAIVRHDAGNPERRRQQDAEPEHVADDHRQPAGRACDGRIVDRDGAGGEACTKPDQQKRAEQGGPAAAKAESSGELGDLLTQL